MIFKSYIYFVELLLLRPLSLYGKIEKNITETVYFFANARNRFRLKGGALCSMDILMKKHASM